MKRVLVDKSEMDLRIYERPLSAILENGKKIKYFDFISSLQHQGCNEALLRMAPKISMEKICKLVDETPFISDLQKTFYKQILSVRKDRIIDYPLSLLKNQERNLYTNVSSTRKCDDLIADAQERSGVKKPSHMKAKEPEPEL